MQLSFRKLNALSFTLLVRRYSKSKKRTRASRDLNQKARATSANIAPIQLSSSYFLTMTCDDQMHLP